MCSVRQFSTAVDQVIKSRRSAAVAASKAVTSCRLLVTDRTGSNAPQISSLRGRAAIQEAAITRGAPRALRGTSAGTTSSSDGQFFRSGRRGSAGSVNARYGPEPGQKIYTHVADTYAPFHAR